MAAGRRRRRRCDVALQGATRWDFAEFSECHGLEKQTPGGDAMLGDTRDATTSS